MKFSQIFKIGILFCSPILLIGCFEEKPKPAPDNTNRDSSLSIIKLINYPQGFNKSGLESLPIELEILKQVFNKDGSIDSITYKDVPDNLTIQYPTIVKSYANKLISVSPGTTEVTLNYKTLSQKCYSTVEFNPLGIYKNGSLIIDFGSLSNQIKYYNTFYFNPTQNINITLTGCNNNLSKNLSNKGCIIIYGGDGLKFVNPGPVGALQKGSCVINSFPFNYTDCTKRLIQASYISENSILVTTNFGDQIITK